jgi:hypothetical protein
MRCVKGAWEANSSFRCANSVKFHPLILKFYQIMMLLVVSAVTFLSAAGASSGAVSSSLRQLFTRASQYPHIVTGDAQNGTAFADIVEVGQVWEWLGGPLLSSLFMDDFYSGRPFSTAPFMRAIFNSNLIVSAVTLRQKRALPNRLDLSLAPGHSRVC